MEVNFTAFSDQYIKQNTTVKETNEFLHGGCGSFLEVQVTFSKGWHEEAPTENSSGYLHSCR